MKLAYTFFSGLVLGAASMLLFLGETGRLAHSEATDVTLSEPAQGRRQSRQISAPGEVTHADEEPVEGTARDEDTSTVMPVPVAGSGLLIPVAGIKADELKPMFDDRRSGGRAHEAIDIMAPRGRPVLAVADGTVRKLFLSRAGGITIYQESANRELMYYYAHLERYADGIREGSKVRRGQVLAYVGSSGNANVNAPHLHFAIFRLPPSREWWKGTAIDPYPYLTAGVQAR